MSCNALYIHIPFCERKCPYCDFYSVPAREALMEQYTDAVLRALKTQPFGITTLDTIYFGGGTPSVLGGRRIAQLLDGISGQFTITPDAEITVECNPHSALADDLKWMRQAGANRLSFGMQSVDDAQLKLLGRLHSAADVPSAVTAAQDAGFAHISLDLMLATPHQTFADVDRAAALCDRLGVEHVSAYLLKIEEGTPFATGNISEDCPDEDGQVALYRHAVEALGALGYQQYEISNFARSGQVARHNLKYWNCEEYLGIGPSAHSFVDGRRRYFERDLNAFLTAEAPFSLLCDDGAGGDAEEYIMLRARLAKGIQWSALSARYPNYDVEALRKKALHLVDRGLVLIDDTGFRLTLDGFLLSNAVIGALI
ncbi:radical SAM family heme chaperone HemW [Oscillospiraceae bacterium PP1C4]